MKKNYILDTNVLILDEKAMFKFEDNNVFIPMAVIDELNYLKDDYKNKDTANAARLANKVIRQMLNSIVLNKSNPNDYLLYIGNNGQRIYFTTDISVDDLNNEMINDLADNKIMLTVLNVKKMFPYEKSVLITNDNGMANRAITRYRLDVEEYKNHMIDKLYKGRDVIDGIENSDLVTEIKNGNAVSLNVLNTDKNLHENQYLCLKTINDDFVTAKFSNGSIKRLETENTKIDKFSVYPKNIGQNFAIDALKSNTPLTIIEGPAGTGKTYLALAVGLDGLLSGKYKQILLLRPNASIDNNNAALPGDEQQKIDPLMRPYWDNLERLLSSYTKNYNDKITLNSLIKEGKIKTESLSYIRGRSIDGTFIICDESQNLLRKHIIGLLTRPTQTSKLVILGDSSQEQIDNPYINQYNNGLVYAMNLMKDSKFSSQVAFTDNESKRSNLVKDVLDRINNSYI